MRDAAGISALVYTLALAWAATDRLATVTRAVAVLLSALGPAVGVLMIAGAMSLQSAAEKKRSPSSRNTVSAPQTSQQRWLRSSPIMACSPAKQLPRPTTS